MTLFALFVIHSSPGANRKWREKEKKQLRYNDITMKTAYRLENNWQPAKDLWLVNEMERRHDTNTITICRLIWIKGSNIILNNRYD